MNETHDSERLRQLQALPLGRKVGFSIARISECMRETTARLCFVLRGKDSTVLLYLVRKLYPDVPAVFCDTGLEYPEIRQFVKTFDNVEF